MEQSGDLEDRWKRVQSAAEKFKKKNETSERAEHVGSFKRTPSAAERFKMQNGTSARASFKRTPSAAERFKMQNGTSARASFQRVPSAAERFKMQNDTSARLEQVGSSADELMPKDDVAAGGMGGEDDLLWQSAMEKYNQESNALLSGNENSQSNHTSDAMADSDHPPTLAQLEGHASPSSANNSQLKSQEEQDLEYARRIAEMDTMGAMEVEVGYNEPPQAVGVEVREGSNNEDSMENLSLWQTFKVLYKRNPMIKYYLLGLGILLVATIAIITVSVTQANKSSSKNCDSASYTEKPFKLIPEMKESDNVRPGGFGTSLSASSEYLIVGAPRPTCQPLSGSTTCDDFTIGGGAYLYRRNDSNEWGLYSSFVFDETKGDEFGSSVAISEDSTTVVIGAPKDDGLGIVAGAIYVMETPFSSATSPIRPDDIGVWDQFGASVSVSAVTIGAVRMTNIVVGAPDDDDFGSNSGGAYVFSKFDREPPASACGFDTVVEVGKWIQCRKLLPDDGGSNDQFGKMVDISGRTVVVGAMWDDDRGIDSGAAYVYYLGDDGDWSFQEKLRPVNFESAQSDRFGVSVATSGDTIVIGADLDDSLGNDSGAAYVYRLTNRAWKFDKKLTPAGSGDHREYNCGFRVDISNDGKTVLVGCPGAPGGGVSYVYNLHDDGNWALAKKLTVPNGVNLSLGGSVALSGEDGLAVVGYGKMSQEVFSYKKGC
eukprot:CAMPEP_0183745228 /NCGR_PEP_ID=MMETSP0737-20130205/66132_1 /TAXON_ID=385413 /ORGANISM="Thalassiosira miniscula, Strain CCMP1093" /LENGTH=713 /DNA_ID=CAMNT_0025980887 /DNA_START=212 /DNA_END=2353 /DNA_ORIENTATION=-